MKTVKIITDSGTRLQKEVIEFVFGHEYLYISYIEDCLRSLVIPLNTVHSVQLKQTKGFKTIKMPRYAIHKN